MSQLMRFGISMEAGLLSQFDALLRRQGYTTRSEAVRDLVRNVLVEDRWGRDQEAVVGTITLVYDHHTRDLSDRLTEQQHAHHHAVISTMHVHLDAHFCLEVIVVKGTPGEVRLIADELIGTRGVVHGKLVSTTTGADLG